MDVNPIRRVARGGVLVLGGGRAGRHVAHELHEHGVTIVEPVPAGRWPNVDLVTGRAIGLDPERRVVRVEARSRRLAIAYAQLVVALGGCPGAVADLGLPGDARGRIYVDERLRVFGAPNIWALGDCALLPKGAPHRTAPAALAAFYEVARTPARARPAHLPGR